MFGNKISLVYIFYRLEFVMTSINIYIYPKKYQYGVSGKRKDSFY